jgi:hypothetical protein
MKDTRVPESRCPFCDAKLDGASSFEGAVPSPGDASVCVLCASALVFQDDLTVRMMTPAEWAELPDGFKDEIRLMQRAVRSVDRRADAERQDD